MRIALYIPVWIDLKFDNFAINVSIESLHSSMDRFKVLDGFNDSIIMSTLHSSMDRFKVLYGDMVL